MGYPHAVQVVDAINGGDTEAFVAALTEDGYVDDRGRLVRGPEGVRSWADADAIGMEARMTVRDVTTEGDTTTMDFDWASRRHNGTSTAVVRVHDGKVASFRIPPYTT